MTRSVLEESIGQLAAARLTGWQGMPGGLREAPTDDTLDAVLGSDRVSAELVLLDDPADGCSARAWFREGETVLIEVSWLADAPRWPADGFTSPEAIDDVQDGLVVVEGGELIFPERGLAVVTNQDATVARHLFGFVPTTVDGYRRGLRPDLAIVRRPVARPTGGEWW